MKNKNRAKSMTDRIDLAYEQEMHELADAIAENPQKNPLLFDPFEDYVDIVRSKFHSNPHVFRSRLVKGYNALLHELLLEGETPQDKPS